MENETTNGKEVLTEEFAEDLNRVLEYLWLSEMKDYVEKPSKNHIFDSLRRLNEALPKLNPQLTEDIGARLWDLMAYTRHVDDMQRYANSKSEEE